MVWGSGFREGLLFGVQGLGRAQGLGVQGFLASGWWWGWGSGARGAG